MTNYDFLSLNDKDFEVLVADLLTAEHGTRFERFKAGKDGGIDGRYFAPDGGQVIVQCKHWAKSGLAALLRSLEKNEKAKVARLKPTRYIIATSISLSAADKVRIRSIFGKFMQSDSDVLGCEDINDLLRKNNHIEKSHFKLWLHSAEVLSTFANAAILGRSAFTLQQIVERSSAYAQTTNHVLAIKKLNTLGVLLITGEPGIGKTTLAEQLCLEYVVDGYQLCVAASQIEELEALFQEDAKQIFYFDDFLGSNFLAVLNRHEDTHIVGFIQRVSKDKKKRFILTSRSTVLNRGKSLTDRFKLAKLERNEFELEVNSLSELDKAKILHSCIWFSELSRKFVEVIIKNQRYRNVINHNNFNPRLIAFVTDQSRFGRLLPSDYWSYIEKTLNNPVDVWDHVFSSQLTDWSRLIVLLIVFSGGPVDEVVLRARYEKLFLDPTVQTYVGDSDFDMCMRLLIGSALNRTTDGKSVTLTLFNPSIADYVLRYSATSQLKLTMLLTALCDVRSLNYFLRLIQNGIISIEIGKGVIAKLCKNKLSLDNAATGIPYQIRLSCVAFEVDDAGVGALQEILAFVEGLSLLPQSAKYLNEIAPLIPQVLKNQWLPIETVSRFLSPIEEGQFDRHELEAAAKIVPLLPSDVQSDFVDAFKPVVVEYWQNAIMEEIVDRDSLGDFYDADDTTSAELIVEKEVNEILSEYGIDFDASDFRAIVKYVDINDILYGNIKRASNNFDDDDHREYVERGMSEIDDLFTFDLPDGG